MEILMIRLEASKETCSERRGLQSLTQPVSVVVSHYPKGSVGMSEPSTLREWGVMAGRWGGGGGPTSTKCC